MTKKSQGEIFGIALLFVIIIVGLIVYSQAKILNPENPVDEITEKKYNIIATGTLDSILELSTGCYVERGKDSLKDLINYCLENSYSGRDPLFNGCDWTDEDILACSKVKTILNDSLRGLFNEDSLGNIPYKFSISIERSPNSLLHNFTLTNFGTFQYYGETLTLDNYRKFKLRKADSGFSTWSTHQGPIMVELLLYY